MKRFAQKGFYRAAKLEIETRRACNQNVTKCPALFRVK
jgi:hypothetical protein